MEFIQIAATQKFEQRPTVMWWAAQSGLAEMSKTGPFRATAELAEKGQGRTLSWSLTAETAE